MCNLHQSVMLQEAPTQKYGYLDIKQSSKVRPRKLKSWRRRWVVLTKLSDLSSDAYVAKLDLYDSQTKWQSNSQDKTTFVLENVTHVRTARSRTHRYAFEVVEKQPVLVLSGETELESHSWMLALQLIFTPEQIDVKKGLYNVTVSMNEHSNRWNLFGEYSMAVSPSCISLIDSEGSLANSWGLNTLIRFNVEKDPKTGQMTMLVIECGPNSPTGQSCFCFLSEEAQDVLGAISQSICLALLQRQNVKCTNCSKQKDLLINENGSIDLPVFPGHRDRSDSKNSHSATSLESVNVVKARTASVNSSSTCHSKLSSSLVTNDKMATINYQLIIEDTDADDIAAEMDTCQGTPERQSSQSQKYRNINGSYTEINDAANGNFLTSFACGTPDFERMRSVSVVVASMQANRSLKPGRALSLEDDNDKTSDLDSAIASMALSTTNDEPLQREMSLQFKEHVCARGCNPSHSSRRRSSSTPDLQAYWKQNSLCKFENVYEELDELRASVQKLNKMMEPDTPPALPERPLIMKTMFSNDAIKMDRIKESSNFRKNGSSKLDEIKVSRQCTCGYAYLRDDKLGYVTNYCSVCGVDKSTQRFRLSISRTSSCEKLIGSTCSSTADLSTVVPELPAVKRRRSSDITPVASSFCLESNAPASNNFHIHEKLLQENMPCIQASVTKHRTNNLSKEQSRISNPLMSFFLDNENFESNPMVTGELPSPSNFSVQANNDAIISTSGYMNSEFAPHELNSENASDFGTNFLLPENNFIYSLLQPVSGEAVKIKRHHIGSNEVLQPALFPTSFSNDPFMLHADAFNPFTWDQKIILYDPITMEHKQFLHDSVKWNHNKLYLPVSSSSNKDIDNVYLTMAMKSYEENFHNTNTPEKIIPEKLHHSKEIDGTYIKPSDLDSKKPGLLVI